MEPFHHHVYVCTQEKPEGAPSCTANGSPRVLEALRREIGKQGLGDEVQVTTCGSIGLCGRGPNMVVYPEGVWYSGVRPEDAEAIVREHFGEGKTVERLLSGDRTTLREEIDTNKRRMLAALKAREDAGLLPDDLRKEMNGFRESRVLLTAIELDAFTAVGSGANAEAVAEALGTDGRATETLLNALVALGVMEKREGVFRNAPVAARYLSAGGKDDSRAALLHTAHLWPRWSTLTECVRQGTSVTRREARRGPSSGVLDDDEWTTAFIAAMHKNAAFRAPLVVQAIGLEGVRRVLDLGGGSGAYSIAFARARPELTADILDRPEVVLIARRHIEEAGLTDRVKARAGDLGDEEYGSGYDLVFLSAICHMNSPDENQVMLRKTFDALEPAGRVVIQDFVLDPDRTGPRTGALFALNMLVGTQAGSSYSGNEYEGWLREAGFGEIDRFGLPGPTDLMVGRRP
jgi:(2Fe-2S) ferredoxin/SAM-dependent methyltransferase